MTVILGASANETNSRRAVKSCDRVLRDWSGWGDVSQLSEAPRGAGHMSSCTCNAQEFISAGERKGLMALGLFLH
jgi:hypothetical protein